MMPKKPGPDVIRAGYRFLGKACPRAWPVGSCSKHNLERDGDSKKSHLAPRGVKLRIPVSRTVPDAPALVPAGSCRALALRRLPAAPLSNGPGLTWDLPIAARDRRAT